MSILREPLDCWGSALLSGKWRRSGKKLPTEGSGKNESCPIVRKERRENFGREAAGPHPEGNGNERGESQGTKGGRGRSFLNLGKKKDDLTHCGKKRIACNYRGEGISVGDGAVICLQEWFSPDRTTREGKGEVMRDQKAFHSLLRGKRR